MVSTRTQERDGIVDERQCGDEPSLEAEMSNEAGAEEISAPQSNMKTTCYFLERTPQEIRDQVYEYVLYDERGFRFMPETNPTMIDRAEQPFFEPFFDERVQVFLVESLRLRGRVTLDILQTCKQIYTEARHIPLQINRFAFDDRRNVGFYAGSPQDAVERFAVENLTLLSLSAQLKAYLSRESSAIGALRYARQIEMRLKLDRRRLIIDGQEVHRLPWAQEIKQLAAFSRLAFPNATVACFLDLSECIISLDTDLFREFYFETLQFEKSGVFSRQFIPYGDRPLGFQFKFVDMILSAVRVRHCGLVEGDIEDFLPQKETE